MRKLFMYFTELEAEFILRFKFKKIIQQIKNSSMDKNTVKKISRKLLSRIFRKTYAR